MVRMSGFIDTHIAGSHERWWFLYHPWFDARILSYKTLICDLIWYNAQNSFKNQVENRS